MLVFLGVSILISCADFSLGFRSLVMAYWAAVVLSALKISRLAFLLVFFCYRIGPRNFTRDRTLVRAIFLAPSIFNFVQKPTAAITEWHVAIRFQKHFWRAAESLPIAVVEFATKNWPMSFYTKCRRRKYHRCTESADQNGSVLNLSLINWAVPKMRIGWFTNFTN